MTRLLILAVCFSAPATAQVVNYDQPYESKFGYEVQAPDDFCLIDRGGYFNIRLECREGNRDDRDTETPRPPIERSTPNPRDQKEPEQSEPQESWEREGYASPQEWHDAQD